MQFHAGKNQAVEPLKLMQISEKTYQPTHRTKILAYFQIFKDLAIAFVSPH